jgi:ribosomal protein L7/L12
MQPLDLEQLKQQVATAAYDRFVARGYEHGHDVEDWLAAEEDILRTPLAIVLVDPGPDKIKLLRAMIELTGLPLAKAHAALGDVPFVIKQTRSLVEVEALRAALEEHGAQVVVTATAR